MPSYKHKIIIPPNGKRKLPIVIGAVFAEAENEGVEMAAKVLCGAGMFDS